MIELIRHSVAEFFGHDHNRLFVVAMRPSQFSYHMKALYLVFVRGNPAPIAVAKRAIFPEGSAGMHNAVRVLAALAGSGFSSLHEHLPVPFGLCAHPSATITIEPYIKGRSLTHFLNERNKIMDRAADVLEAIAKIKKAAGSHPVMGQDPYNYLNLLNEVENRLAPFRISHEVRESLSRSLASLRGIPFNTFCHLDLWPEDVILDGNGRIVILDWESATWQGPSFIDEIMFAVSLIRLAEDDTDLVSAYLALQHPVADYQVKLRTHIESQLDRTGCSQAQRSAYWLIALLQSAKNHMERYPYPIMSDWFPRLLALINSIPERRTPPSLS